jgi:hypothetical protein
MESLVFQARVAESAEQFDQMLAVVSKIMQFKNQYAADNKTSETSSFTIEYPLEERILISDCFRQMIRAKQQAYKKLKIISSNPKYKANTGEFEVYARKLQWEVHEGCLQVIGLLDSHALPETIGLTHQARAFFT